MLSTPSPSLHLTEFSLPRAIEMASSAQFSLTFKPLPSPLFSNFPRTRFSPFTTARPIASRFKVLASQIGFFTRLGRLIKEKAKSDVEKIFSGFSKTRDNLAVIDELLLYWNLADTDRVLDELEEALLVSDFGPRITIKIVERLREDILSGKLKSGSEIKDALKKSVLDLLTTKGSNTELRLGFRKPAVIMIVGVNGGGKTTSLGKLAYRLKNEGAKILMAAGDTFRAAASDQLEIWAERTGCEIVVAEKENAKASSVLSQAVKRGKEQGFDVVLCDTSGRLHTNYSLMEELIACKKAVEKVVRGAPNVVGITGFILTKLDGSARGGCVVPSLKPASLCFWGERWEGVRVSVVDELGIPVKFVGVGEGVEDLQPFDAEAFNCNRLRPVWLMSGFYTHIVVRTRSQEYSFGCVKKLQQDNDDANFWDNVASAFINLYKYATKVQLTRN
ncbi:Cell division FtsY, chloroplastic -like protein [Gossypium arboreum]|uniref:Cell division FtsY, chloroplastic-like protein n=1 Tax=Gossypium arboreum TaxID=29729 RepID=A0A0B0MG56_GOSAR|nr:Cell division FtsY, chloroplastic -like protein [Gossypium arboreum]